MNLRYHIKNVILMATCRDFVDAIECSFWKIVVILIYSLWL